MKQLLGRALEYWVRISAPSLEAMTLQDRERKRRGEVASIILPIIIVLACLPLPLALRNPVLLRTLILVVLLDLFALFFLNKRGHVTAAGIVVVIGIEVGLGSSILLYPGGMGPSNLPLFDLTVQALVVAVAMIFPPSLVFAVALLNIVFLVVVVRSGVTTPELAHLVARDPGRLLIQPITLQVAVATYTFIATWSKNRAMIRADRAEEIVALQEALAQQTQQAAQQKQQLDDELRQLKGVLADLANGREVRVARVLPMTSLLGPLAWQLDMFFQRHQSVILHTQNAAVLLQMLRANTEQLQRHAGNPLFRFQKTQDAHLNAFLSTLNYHFTSIERAGKASQSEGISVKSRPHTQ